MGHWKPNGAHTSFTGADRWENRVLRGQPEYGAETELERLLGKKKSWWSVGKQGMGAGVGGGQADNTAVPGTAKFSDSSGTPLSQVLCYLIPSMQPVAALDT